MSGKRKRAVVAEFHTVKRIDNSRLVRNVEPAKMRNLWRTVALGEHCGGVFHALHFPALSLHRFEFSAGRFEGPANESRGVEFGVETGNCGLRDPMRIDVIARRRLGLTEPLPSQVQEYDEPDGAEVAAHYVRPNHVP